MCKKLMSRLVLGVGLILASVACELEVTNLNEPDRDRALADAGNLEALIGGTFTVFYDGLDLPSVVNIFPPVGAEMTSTNFSFRGLQNNTEPRPAYSNALSIGSSGPWGPRRFNNELSSILGSLHDGLAILDSGTKVEVGTNDFTERARAFGKFMQGVAWAYMGMLFDQAIYVPEDIPFDETDPVQQGLDAFADRDLILGHALTAIDDAIAIAVANPSISYPSAGQSLLYFGTPSSMSSAEFIQLANSMAARILVLSARNPAERRTVDWNQVLQRTANGLTSDFEVELSQGRRTSLLYARTQNNPVACGNCLRMDYRTIGLADVSGAYQAWFALPFAERRRFDIVTPDRRITGATPQDDGAYFQWHLDNNGFQATSGLYLFSAYQWGRHLNAGFESNEGTQPMLTVDENNLYRAEALLRTGDLAGAAALVNITRTRAHTVDGVTYPGLPAVTTAGVPAGADCLPRTDLGACGDLMVALRYERMIELVGLDAVRGWLDSRGLAIVPDGTWIQLPVPIEQLNQFGLPTYSFGGVGDTWGAVYGPITMADL